MDEEVVLGALPGLAIGCESAARHEKVNMRVITQVTCPRLQDTDQTNPSAHKARVLSQLLQRLGGGAKE
jgi:hypothetical protein